MKKLSYIAAGTIVGASVVAVLAKKGIIDIDSMNPFSATEEGGCCGGGHSTEVDIELKDKEVTKV
jgi:hypothetical protein